jgi:hypothetical protein
MLKLVRKTRWAECRGVLSKGTARVEILDPVLAGIPLLVVAHLLGAEVGVAPPQSLLTAVSYLCG